MPHPGAPIPGEAITAAPYKVKLLTRCRIAGVHWRCGAIITVPADRLRVAAHLCRSGAARPADEVTALDVALFEALRTAPP